MLRGESRCVVFVWAENEAAAGGGEQERKKELSGAVWALEKALGPFNRDGMPLPKAKAAYPMPRLLEVHASY